MITLRDTVPGTDRSIPACCTTSICPSATTASTAAKGSIPCSELRPRLSGCSSRLTRNSSAVATRIVTSPREARCAVVCRQRLGRPGGWAVPEAGAGDGAECVTTTEPLVVSLIGSLLGCRRTGSQGRTKSVHKGLVDSGKRLGGEGG